MGKESFLVLDLKTSNLYNDIEVSVISTEGLNKIPFGKKIILTADNTKLKKGDLIYTEHGTKVVEIVPYNIHSYELATVIGVQEKDLLLDGDKIGERIINNYPSKPQLQHNNATFGIQRGDELLLTEYLRGEYAIVHNITQAKMKYYRRTRKK